MYFIRDREFCPDYPWFSASAGGDHNLSATVWLKQFDVILSCIVLEKETKTMSLHLCDEQKKWVTKKYELHKGYVLWQQRYVYFTQNSYPAKCAVPGTTWLAKSTQQYTPLSMINFSDVVALQKNLHSPIHHFLAFSFHIWQRYVFLIFGAVHLYAHQVFHSLQAIFW